MRNNEPRSSPDPTEVEEWLLSLDEVVERHGADGAGELLALVRKRARQRGVAVPFELNTPYVNTIPAREQPSYPGNREIERRIKSIVRWNAMAMTVRANRASPGIGGHISTYASAATLFEVGFNHFFRAGSEDEAGDLVYFQGHASPGVYARAFLEGRLTEEHLTNFRRELATERGLSSYPHPWLMPGFWQFPTVSMGLSAIMAIYQARFLRYLENRGIKDTSDTNVWCLLGDGECDEPETLGSLTLAAREGLDNLIFVVNCNLQRLDGPVRGNGKVIQELEALFRGAGWNVIKVIWGGYWDPLLAADADGRLVERMGEVVDGQYQKYTVESGAYIREDFFGKSPELARLVEDLSDQQLRKLNRGGHDPEKVYAAYRAAVEHTGSPTVILAKTIKGYGLGEAGEGRNVTHQQKKLNEEELREFRSRFAIPIGDDEVDEAPFYRPADDSTEMEYLEERRRELGGSVPSRRAAAPALDVPSLEAFKEFLKGSGERDVATTMAFVRMLRVLLGRDEIGAHVVPIIPDEARTFGMDALFRRYGIYSCVGQRYEPVDSESLLYYRESKDGQILEEGITEAGSMSSFIAAGTAYSTLGVNMIPFYAFYSMFGFQRIGDLIWAAADARSRGFLLGCTAGRTTLAGEGLQHQDGHSHLLAATVPTVRAYDPAYAYELAVIVQDGLRRLYREAESAIYYLTLYNEQYVMPEMPTGAEEGILKGMYRLDGRAPEEDGSGDGSGDSDTRPRLLGSGAILREVLRARELLDERFGVESEVWSVTSYNELRREALEVERWNRLHPEDEVRTPYVETCLSGGAPIVAVTDYMRLVPDQIARWIPRMSWVSLGTDGFGRSDDRESLRRHFEVSAEHVAYAAAAALVRSGRDVITKSDLVDAMREWGIDPEAASPALL